MSFLLPAFAGTSFAGMTKRGGYNSLIICLLYYFSTKWEMNLISIYHGIGDASEEISSIFFG